MKKLLTILVLALALCLVCSAAMATDEIDLKGKAYNDATQALRTEIKDNITGIDYNGKTISFHVVPANAITTMKCLETKTLRYECTDYDPSVTLWFNFIYTKSHNVDTTTVGTVLKDPTCTENAKMAKICPDCGAKVEYSYAGTIATYLKTGHSWEQATPDDGIQVITTAPTCESTGVWEYYCSNGCGTKNPNKAAQVMEAAQHEFAFSWVIAPTCKSKGVAEYSCVRCGVDWNTFIVSGSEQAKKITPYRKNTVADILATKYSVDAAIAETRLNFAEITAYLQDKEDTHYMGHDFDNWIPGKAATCATRSTRERWCPVCGEKQELPAKTDDRLKANYVMTSKVRKGDCRIAEFTFKCANCVANGTTTHGVLTVELHDKHKASDYATLSSEEWDWIGMDPNQVVRVDAHEYVLTDATTKVKGKALATCTNGGYEAYKCKWDTNTYEIKKGTDGEYYIDPTPGVHPLKYVNETEKLGHNWGEWKMIHAPKEYDNENGVWVRKCERCGETENRISPYYPDACEKHDFEEIEAIAATCTEDGVKVLSCKVCGYTEEEAIPATGHDWDVTVKKAATCTEEGLVTSQSWPVAGIASSSV